MNTLRVLNDLIRIHSENPGPGEREICEYIQLYLDNAGIVYSRIQPAPNRVSIVGSIKGAYPRNLLFNGHIDTKPADGNWDHDPYEPFAHEGRVYGLGTADMKGGIAAILTALCEFTADGETPQNTVSFQFVADEEMNSTFGTRYLIKKKLLGRVDLAIVGEPSSLKLATKSVGNMWITIGVQGERRHAGVYWKGKNAIVLMEKLLHRIRLLVRQTAQRDWGYPRFPNVNIGRINGGFHPGSVPDFCEATIDVRFTNETMREEYLTRIRSAAKELSTRSGCTINISEYAEGMPAWEANSGDKDTREITRLVNNSHVFVTGKKVECTYFNGGSDAGVLRELTGTPSYIFGPGSLFQAHAPNEWVDSHEVETAQKIYLQMMRQWGALR